MTAFKFRDPDGHPLELLSFPPGVGDAVWQARGGASVFLGIDHTAVSVAESARSRAFFETLGLSAQLASINHGVEQERLDEVDNVRVTVLPLLPLDPTPHVELLGYAVGLRRPMPADTQMNDIWATRVWLDVARLPSDATDSAVLLEDGRRASLMHDPDRHALVLAESARRAE